MPAAPEGIGGTVDGEAVRSQISEISFDGVAACAETMPMPTGKPPKASETPEKLMGDLHGRRSELEAPPMPEGAASCEGNSLGAAFTGVAKLSTRGAGPRSRRTNHHALIWSLAWVTADAQGVA